MRKRIIIAAAAAAAAAAVAGVVVLAAGAAAVATPASPPPLFSSSTVSVGRFGDIDVKTNDANPHHVKIQTKGESDVYVVMNTVQPGGNSGWHTHPGPSLITVTQGTATFYDADDPTCTPRTVSAPNGTIDPGDGHVHLLRNEGTVTLVTVTVAIIPAGAARRIDAPAPANCPI